MLRIYNTLTRKKEAFRPRQGKGVRMFVCGPTVYDFSHVGHGRTYVVFDVVARYLRSLDYRVRYVQNITDVDDKILARAVKTQRPWRSIAREFERAYIADIARLSIQSVTHYARATSYIPEIAAQVQRLIKRGAAYRIDDGIYFELRAFPRYGHLAGRTMLAAEDAVTRIDESVQKRNRGDFCLWKFTPRNAGTAIPSWNTKLGAGRPGWHIEDTAIAHKLLGAQYDLHGGALDLIFPHHEAEIAQMETAYGKHPMVRFWMHTGFLTVHGEKMSKSVGNFVTLRELLQTWPAEVFRLFVLSSHYRSPVDYSEDLLAHAASAWERLSQCAERLGTRKPVHKKSSPLPPRYANIEEKFSAALDNDFDTPKALAALFELVRRVNPDLETGRLTPAMPAAQAIRSFLSRADAILGILPKTKRSAAVPEEILALAAQRESFRRSKRFADADAIRAKLQTAGWIIEDASTGPRLKRTNPPSRDPLP